MKIGVLALQGAVAEHIRILSGLNTEAFAVKKAEQLKDCDGLVLPGGESTTMGKLLVKYDMVEALKAFHADGKPIFGTCAGLILLAKRIEGQDEIHLGLMDIAVNRNAFGRQRESFETDLRVEGVADDFRAVFIRAPYVTRVGEGVQVLSRFQDKIVAVEQGGNLLAAAFHPELTEDPRMHRYFVRMVEKVVAKC